MNKKLTVFLPFSLTAAIITLDQITKGLIVHFLPIPPGAHISGSTEVLGDFLRFTHIRNTAIAFGMGDSFPPVLKSILFLALPLILLTLLVVYYLKTKDLRTAYRWIIAAILGGGIGNVIDRVFRPAGVVDFIDVKFYGILGMARWPTFNLADSSIVITAFILLLLLISDEITNYQNKKRSTYEQKS